MAGTFIGLQDSAADPRPYKQYLPCEDFVLIAAFPGVAYPALEPVQVADDDSIRGSEFWKV